MTRDSHPDAIEDRSAAAPTEVRRSAAVFDRLLRAILSGPSPALARIRNLWLDAVRSDSRNDDSKVHHGSGR